MKYLLFCLVISLPVAYCAPIEVGVTVDDVPASSVEWPGVSRTAIANDFIATLAKFKVPTVYGFVNGILAHRMGDRQQILESWKKGGHLLGNHTYSHLDLNQVDSEKYKSDIEKNESILIDHASNINELKVFRYPYLSEGKDLKKRYAIRSYLAKRKYKVAQVSIDFEDWRWAEPFIRCKKKSDQEGLAFLRKSYLEALVNRLQHTDKLSKLIYGAQRKIKHILLLHLSPVTNFMLNDVLETLKKNNVNFIDSQDAINDPIYEEDTSYIGPIGVSFFIQAALARGIKIDPIPAMPKQELESVCRK